ncbi:MAG: hypothetical protein IKN65_06850 [Clostridia bacterium]|nr:hypothetical protein [Clostridia bacterium]
MSKHNKNIRNLSISDFYCTQCGLKGVPILRTAGREREPGHLKKLFCLNCQKECNMVEIKPRGKYTLDDFLLEFEHGNFDENGNRKKVWKQFIREVKNNE